MFGSRHEEACELIHERIAHAKRVCNSRDTGYRIIIQIEQILTMTESRIQDDLENMAKGCQTVREEGLREFWNVVPKKQKKS